MSKAAFLSLAILILMFSSSIVVAGEDFECYLAEEALDSPFLLDGSDAVTIEGADEPNDLKFNHTIKFRNGMVVSYSAGGCVHHQQFLEFFNVPFSLGEAFDDESLQKIMSLFKVLPFEESKGGHFLGDLEYLYSNKENVDALMCDDCGEAQIAVYDENGKIIALDIDDSHAFSFRTDFPL